MQTAGQRVVAGIVVGHTLSLPDKSGENGTVRRGEQPQSDRHCVTFGQKTVPMCGGLEDTVCSPTNLHMMKDGISGIAHQHPQRHLLAGLCRF